MDKKINYKRFKDVKNTEKKPFNNKMFDKKQKTFIEKNKTEQKKRK